MLLFYLAQRLERRSGLSSKEHRSGARQVSPGKTVTAAGMEISTALKRGLTIRTETTSAFPSAARERHCHAPISEDLSRSGRSGIASTIGCNSPTTEGPGRCVMVPTAV
jgi:hypothetical protein